MHKFSLRKPAAAAVLISVFYMSLVIGGTVQ
jgi:hypothetical protein